jgi:hypothetical protein
MVTLGSRHDITLDAYRRVAWEGDSVAIAAEAIEQMAEANRAFLALIDSSPDLSVYMVTTGGGEWAKQRVSPGDWNAADRPREFNLQLAFGEPLPERVTRGFALARLANFLGGHAAAHPSVAGGDRRVARWPTTPAGTSPRPGRLGRDHSARAPPRVGARDRNRAEGHECPRQRLAVRSGSRR